MATNKRTYQIDILAKLDEAITSVNKFSKEAQKELDAINFNTTISAIKDGFDIVRDVAKSAFATIKAFGGEAIAKSNEAARENLSLANALRLTGDFSQEAVANFEKLADSIEATTNFTGGAVKSSLALAKQYRLTNQEAERAVQVAADLAAIQGTTLQEATTKISQSFSGFVDKGLAKVIPGLKNLSKEALVAGDAVALIAARVQGSAEAFGDTFEGALFRAKESVNKLYESLGDLITQNPAIIAGFKEIAKGFREFAGEIDNNKVGLQDLVTEGFLFLVESTPLVIKSLRLIDNTMSTLIASTKSFIITATGLPTALLQAATGSFDALDDLKTRLAEVDTAVNFSKRDENIYAPLIKQSTELASRIRKVSEEASKQKDVLKNLGASITGEENRKGDLFNAEELKKQITEIAREPIKFTLQTAIKNEQINAKQASAIGVGIVGNILKGAEGAKKTLQEIGSAVGDAILPGIGGAVSEIVGVLSQGPEEVRKQVREFAKAIPQLIQNIAQAFPVLIEEIAKNLPAALAKAMPQVALSFSIELIKNMPQIVKGFAQGLIDGAKAFVDEIINQIKSVGGLFGGDGPIADAGGFLGDLAGEVGGFFDSLNPFATGGRIPDIGRFRGDGAVIRADAGEQILSRDLSNQLENFLAGQTQQQDQGQPLIVNLVVGQQQLARAILDLNRGGFRTA